MTAEASNAGRSDVGRTDNKLGNCGNTTDATCRPRILPLGCNKCCDAAISGAVVAVIVVKLVPVAVDGNNNDDVGGGGAYKCRDDNSMETYASCS